MRICVFICMRATYLGYLRLIQFTDEQTAAAAANQYRFSLVFLYDHYTQFNEIVIKIPLYRLIPLK